MDNLFNQSWFLPVSGESLPQMPLVDPHWLLEEFQPLGCTVTSDPLQFWGSPMSTDVKTHVSSAFSTIMGESGGATPELHNRGACSLTRTHGLNDTM